MNNQAYHLLMISHELCTSLTVVMMLQSGAFPTIAGEAYLLVVFVWSLTIPPHYSLDADRFHHVIKAILELGIDMLTVVCLGLLIVLFFAAAIRVVKNFGGSSFRVQVAQFLPFAFIVVPLWVITYEYRSYTRVFLKCYLKAFLILCIVAGLVFYRFAYGSSRTVKISWTEVLE